MFGLWSFLKKKVYKRVYNAICIYYPRHILRHYIISWKHWPPPPPPFGVLILIWWLNTYVIFYLLNGNNFSFLSDYVFLNKKHIMFPNKTSTPRSVFHNYIVYTQSFEKLCVNFFSSFLQKMAKSKCIQKVLYNTC